VQRNVAEDANRSMVFAQCAVFRSQCSLIGGITGWLGGAAPSGKHSEQISRRFELESSFQNSLMPR